VARGYSSLHRRRFLMCVCRQSRRESPPEAIYPQIAEKLYQQGFLSYPRTETDKFDPQFNFMSLIEKQMADPAWGGFAREYVFHPFGRVLATYVLNKFTAGRVPATEERKK